MRKLVYLVGTTLDGFIAGPGGETDFFPVSEDVIAALVADWPETLPTSARDALGVSGENPTFDTGVMGRQTYLPALDVGVSDPYAHLQTYVVSSALRSPAPTVTVVEGDPVGLVRRLKAESGKDIWLIGGGRLAGALLAEIDALVLKVYPVAAGAGTPLFSADFAPQAFRLLDVRALPSGTVILRYERAG